MNNVLVPTLSLTLYGRHAPRPLVGHVCRLSGTRPMRTWASIVRILSLVRDSFCRHGGYFSLLLPEFGVIGRQPLLPSWRTGVAAPERLDGETRRCSGSTTLDNSAKRACRAIVSSPAAAGFRAERLLADEFAVAPAEAAVHPIRLGRAMGNLQPSHA